jgi:hypothetical protein
MNKMRVNKMGNVKFKAEMLEKMVHEWGKEGQGAYIQTMGGHTLGYFLTLAEAIKACADFIGYEGEIEKDYFYDGVLQLAVIENSEGYQDDNGAYISDYTFAIEKHEISAITEQDLDKILR